MSNMPATLLVRRRVVLAEDAFAEIVVWRLPRPAAPSGHSFKYRLAYVVGGRCVIRYDNEAGKGDHRHAGRREQPYAFTSAQRLLEDFESDIGRWNRENGRT